MPKTLQRKRLANDDVSDDVMKNCLRFLQNRLSPEDMARMKQILMASGETAANTETQTNDTIENADNIDDDSEKDEAMDSPPPFKGMPRSGGTMVAQDARPRSYADRWPNAARIRQGY